MKAELVAAGYAGAAGMRRILSERPEIAAGRMRPELVRRLREVPDCGLSAAALGEAEGVHDPARETPGDKGPLGEAPGGKGPLGEAPGGKASLGKMPGGKTPLSVVPGTFLRELGVTAVYPAFEGGVLRALYKLLTGLGCGARVRLGAVPVLQGTVELCELLSLNPYRLYSGCHILVCENGTRAAEELKARGAAASVIGYLTDDQDKLITDKSAPEYLNRPGPDELFQVLDMKCSGKKETEA